MRATLHMTSGLVLRDKRIEAGPYLEGYDFARDSLICLTRMGTSVTRFVDPRIRSFDESRFLPHDLHEAVLRIPCTK